MNSDDPRSCLSRAELSDATSDQVRDLFFAAQSQSAANRRHPRVRP
jgi:hypothetical protein